MIVALYAPSDEYDTGLSGRFGMALEDAKDYLLAKARELGLTPIKEELTDQSYYVDLCPDDVEPPWMELRKLAEVFAVPYNAGGDPPLAYRLVVLEDPPEGQYKPF